jgi:mono/diheme cytochrome c family protein
MPTILCAMLMALLVSGPLTNAADRSDASARGLAVVERWCGTCHVAANAEQGPDMAPSFESIVRRPGRDAAYLRRFLDQDHFPMTTYRLFATEKDDVVAYLDSLR